MDLNSILLDPIKSKGVSVPILDDKGETVLATLLIAPANAIAYDNKLGELMIARRDSGQKLDIEDKATMDAFQLEATASVVLVGWTGFTKDGVDFPYSVENAKYLLTNSPQIARTVRNESNKFANFSIAAQKEGADNLRSFPEVVPPVGE